MDREKQKKYLPIVLGLLIGAVLAVLILTGKLAVLADKISAFFAGGPAVSTWVWLVLLAALVGIYWFVTNKKTDR